MSLAFACSFVLSSHGQNMWIKGHLNARNSISETSIRSKIEFLTDSLCSGRATGTRGGIEAAAWIANNFERSNLLKSEGTYFRRFKTSTGILGTNVIGFLPGSKETSNNKYIIVASHFDHLGVINGQMYPGADSNASGVAVLLSLTEMFSEMKNGGKSWPTNLIFVALDGNSHDLAGSKALWKMIEQGKLTDPISGGKITKRMISLMVNIDQIGSSLSPLKSHREDYIIMLGNTSIHKDRRERISMCNKLYLINLDLSLSYYGSESFTKMFYNMSDQKIFIDNHIPAVMFTSGITMNNNKTRDTAASLNYPILKKRTWLIYHWIEMMM